MLIDWFTVGAQALNFVILVWLMKRFLYVPVLDAIDAREKRIATQLGDAAAKETQARTERDDFQHKNEVFDQQRAELLGRATDEAKVERQRLIEEARKAADALTAKRRETLSSDAQHLDQAIGRRMRQEVFAVARKALADLASAGLEERMVEVFTRRLGAMDGPAKQAFAAALKSASEPALVCSAFELPAEQRAAIQTAVNEAFAAEISLRFETRPDLVSGVELASNGQKLSWSIADYLTSLEKLVGELVEKPVMAEAANSVADEPKPVSMSA